MVCVEFFMSTDMDSKKNLAVSFCDSTRHETIDRLLKIDCLVFDNILLNVFVNIIDTEKNLK